MVNICRVQVAIVGGGICGLWLLASLRAAGLSALLLERSALGGGQTLASQGMIHGGIKYALGGFTTTFSETIRDMPERWNRHLSGMSEPDLSSANLLSRDYYLFSDKRLSSRITAFFGSKAIRGRVEKVAPDNYPEAFANQGFKGILYRLQDMVVDSRSLIEVLASKSPGRIFLCEPNVHAGADGNITHLEIGGGDILQADFFIFAAGAGNEALIANTALGGETMQRRPLKQVMVKSQNLPPVFAHGVGAATGSKPRVTITTHKALDGSPVWYLGGQLAEAGAVLTNANQIAMAQAEIHELFPWVDLTGAVFRTFDIDRAEPAQENHTLPDTPYWRAAGNAVVCWPTKLTLTPLLATDVLAHIQAHSSAIPTGTSPEHLPQLPAAPVGQPPWETCFDQV